MKKTYSNPISKVMVVKNESFMNNTVYGEPDVIGGVEGDDDDMGWGGGHSGGNSGADSNKGVWDE